eukprot:gene35206-43402_t
MVTLAVGGIAGQRTTLDKLVPELEITAVVEVDLMVQVTVSMTKLVSIEVETTIDLTVVIVASAVSVLKVVLTLLQVGDVVIETVLKIPETTALLVVPDEEVIDDPRFAGKFGSGGGGTGYRPVFGGQQQKSAEVTSFALPSGPRSTQASAPPSIPVPIAPPTVSAEVKAMEELKIAKVAEKKEIQNKAKLAKEQAAEAAAAALAKQKADALIAGEAAKEILASGKKGAELLDV